jgi:dihydroflavonol-4-reductase
MINVVIGATGHLGNTLVRELVKDGEEVRAIVLPGDNLEPLKGLKVEVAYGDITKQDFITKALKGADVVYHMAGAVVITQGRKEFLEKVNIEGTKNVINACMENNIKRLVYTSSVHALREPAKGTVINEEQPFDPEQVFGEYSKTKAKASLEVINAVKNGLDAVILCPTGVVGPNDFKISQMGQFIIDFVQGRLKAYIDGAYDFADVRDVARGHILAAQNGRKGEVYILSGERVTVSGLVNYLREITGKRGPTFKMPYFLAKITAPLTPIYYFFSHTKPLFTTYSIRVLASNSKISSEKAQKELGYKSRPVKESLKDAYLWFKEKGIL